MEIQHIDQAELLVVEHPENGSVLLDQRGHPPTINRLQEPAIASTASGTDLSSVLRQKDRQAYFFDGDPELFNGVSLQLSSYPTGITNGTWKLIVR